MHDLADFCQVAEMMKVKKHITLEGLEQIRKIKAGTLSSQSSLTSRIRFYSTSSSLIILNKNAQVDPL